MNKRILGTLAVLIFLAVMFAIEINNWRRFDWSIFLANARYVSLTRAAFAVALIHMTFLLRAIRWSVLLRPQKDVPAVRLIGPTFVGFAGLALLGRAGELVRPYLISRREGLTVSSQLAALTLERIFDTAAVGIVILTAILASSSTKPLPFRQELRQGTFFLLILVAGLSAAVFVFARNGARFGRFLLRVLSPLPAGIGKKAAAIVGDFSADLGVRRDAKSLAQILLISIAVWLFIGLSYFESLHAFGSLWRMSMVDALILMGFGLLGSLIQLPGGGAPQLFIIAALVQVFGVSAELAVSCGILGWLTIYMAPVPLGILLLRQQNLSLRALRQVE